MKVIPLRQLATGRVREVRRELYPNEHCQALASSIMIIVHATIRTRPKQSFITAVYLDTVKAAKLR